MRLVIKTAVGAKRPAIKTGFTKELFLSLNPPFPPVKLLQFDGCKTGDKVALELNFIFFRQQWISDIIEDSEGGSTWCFVDRGIKLPFFLSTWQHRHSVIDLMQGSEIIDDIEFSTGLKFVDLLMYPVLYLQFLYRKPIYKSVFKAE
ncbi:MAG: ligand-binding SRPBCC domain-containing protein [Cyclobacteriaceae bacterium]|jgi:ligand-binding SRPBCC domain-containing protein